MNQKPINFSRRNPKINNFESRDANSNIQNRDLSYSEILKCPTQVEYKKTVRIEIEPRAFLSSVSILWDTERDD